jgi:hypothetical protein
MCISSANEGKTKVRWAIVVGQIVQRWTSENNIFLKGSPYSVLDLDEMIVKSPCIEASKKYSRHGCV